MPSATAEALKDFDSTPVLPGITAMSKALASSSIYFLDSADNLDPRSADDEGSATSQIV